MTSQNAEQATILLVDDIPQNLKVLIDFLEQSGFRIVVAESGKAAIQRAQQAHPDLILLDVLMPEMDGFETCQRLKAQESLREIPVIFLTGISDLIEKVKGFELGGVDYITKPVHHQEVLARINAHLTMHRLQQQLEEQNERFRTLSEATFEGILIHNQGKILDINSAVEKMFGYQRAEALGHNVVEFVTPESQKFLLDRIQEQQDTPYETTAVRRDGSSFPIEIQARTMPYHGCDVRVAAIRDLSWYKQLEAEKAQLQQENIILRSSLGERYKFGGMIGKSPAMQTIYQAILKAAASDAHVVICGESGTGKELVARTIHSLSERSARTFVAVNCGGVPEALFEREFFGHRKGAFTGADRDKSGYFDRAYDGTLFLDEIGELTPAMQVKLLRVLQDGEYTPLGDTVSKQARARIITATNKDLKKLLHTGQIREDFFYRIRVMVITLPPLRERREDIPLLVEHFWEQYQKGNECPPLSARVLETLCAYDWPGNVRELQNELQRYLAEQRFEFIGNLSPDFPGQDRGQIPEFSLEGMSLHEVVEAVEKHLIARALAQNAGHQGKTAEMLHISPRALYERMKKYHLHTYKDERPQ